MVLPDILLLRGDTQLTAAAPGRHAGGRVTPASTSETRNLVSRVEPLTTVTGHPSRYVQLSHKGFHLSVEKNRDLKRLTLSSCGFLKPPGHRRFSHHALEAVFSAVPWRIWIKRSVSA